MPIYNGIEFIEDSLNSVINQSYSKWELIISINGHDKNSEIYNIAKRYESDKIKIFDMYYIKGKSNTLNNSIQYCKYDNICILDVDDIWVFNKLEKQIDFINKYDVVGANCQYFGNINNYPNIPLGEINKLFFKKLNPIINSSSCFNKKYAYWNCEYDGVEDYDMWLRLLFMNKTFYNIPDILVYHRIHNNSFFNKSNNQNILRNELLKKYFKN